MISIIVQVESCRLRCLIDRVDVPRCGTAPKKGYCKSEGSILFDGDRSECKESNEEKKKLGHEKEYLRGEGVG